MERASASHYPRCSGDDDNAAFTRKALLQLEGQLRGVCEEIEDLRGRIGALEKQQKALKRHVDIRNTLRVPINRIPLSLLQDIFILCLPFSRNPVMSNREAPVLLGQVCRKWRQVALDTSQLWSSIHILLFTSRYPRYLSYASRKYEILRLQAISSWLLRSGDLPLSISFVALDPLMTASPPLIERMITPYVDLLSSFSPRWRVIYITIHGVDWTKYFFSRFKKQDLPLLERLHIDGTKCNAGKLTSARATKALMEEDSFLRCPKLQWLSLPLLGELVVEVPVPWSQLTTLNLDGACSCALFQIMATLALCPNLEFLSICFDIAATGADLALEQTVTLPHLATLCIADRCTSYDSLRFFNHLNAPTIRTIFYDRFAPSSWLSHIITRESLSKGLVKAFGSFISRTKGPIEELSIRYEWLAAGELYKILALLPDLKRLSLRGSGKSLNSGHIELQPKPLELGESLIQNLLTIPDKGNIVVVTTDACDAEATELIEDEAESSDNVSGGGSSKRPSGITRLTDGGGEGDVWQETYNFFCPKLEILQCTAANFSGQSVLKFLQSRAASYKRFGILRIRGVDITFDHGQDRPPTELIEEIKELTEEAGISVFLHYLSQERENSPSMPSFSPYNGAYVTGFRDYDTPIFNSIFRQVDN